MFLNSTKKKYISMRFLSFIIFLSITCSIFSSGFPAEGPSGSCDVVTLDSSSQKELHHKLDSLRAEHVLDSVDFLQNEDSLIGDNEWEELEIENVLEHWKKYQKTKLDAWGVRKLLRYAPKGSKELIKLLIEDDEAFERVNNIIVDFVGCQDALIAYWDETNMLHKGSRALYYSIFSKILPKINNKLNSSLYTLELSQILGIAKPAFTLLALLGVSGVLSGYFCAKFYGMPFSWKQSIIRGFKKPIDNHNIFPAVYKDEYDYNLVDKTRESQIKLYRYLTKGTLGDSYVVIKVALKKLLGKVFGQNGCTSMLAGGVSAGFNGGMLAWGDYQRCMSFKNSVNRIIFLHKTAEALQHNLVAIADLLRSLEGLGLLGDMCNVDKNPLVIENIKKYTQAKDMPVGLKELFKFLGSSTFESKASYVYSRGSLLKTHLLLTHVKNDMIPLLQNIALLGGYRAIAHMVRDHKDARVGFCFVKPEVTSNGGPMVRMKNAWLPLIDIDKVVTNNVNLGVDGGPRNAVVTGPNGGGKTTFMLTVALNLLLSSLGIAAADEAEMSGFVKIRTSLRPQQDLKSGLSAFMAEHKRVDQVDKSIHSCDGNILVLLDEPYKGTVEIESATRIYKFGKKIATKSNCMLLLATHLRKPIELPAATANVFTNYQMGYIETKSDILENRGFTRTFKILDGPAIWWFDDADKRARFIDWLCEQEIKD